MGRISENQGGATEYYLGDALGSVRQLTDSGGEVTLTRHDDPFGNVEQSLGNAQTDFGFTGELTDASGLVYLRAKYYAPEIGRFLTRDTWGGDTGQPMSLNRWNYVTANPTNHIDPSGRITQDEAYEANRIVEYLNSTYNVQIDKDWGFVYWSEYDFVPANGIPWISKNCEWWDGNWRNLHELELTRDAIDLMSQTLGGASKFISAMKGQAVDVIRYTDFSNWAGFAPHPAIDQFFGEVMLFNGAFSSDGFAKEVVVHELGHVWDFRQRFKLSGDLVSLTKPYKKVCARGGCTMVWDPDSAIERFPTEYAKENKREYWAESFMAYVIPSSGNLGPIVTNYVKTKIQSIQ